MVSTILLTIFYGLAILLGIGGMLLLFAEAILRSFWPQLDHFYILRPCQRKMQHFVSGLMPGMGPVSYFVTNTLGIRAGEFSNDDDYRILALGCSVTISQYVDQYKTWPALLERKLSSHFRRKIWVGNVGKSEVTTRQLLTYFKYFIPQYRDKLDAIILLAGVNDMTLMLSKREAYEPGFWERASTQYQISHSFEWFPRSYAQPGPFYRRTLLWKLFSRIKNRLRMEEWHGVGSDYVQLRQRRMNASAYFDDLPDLTLGLDEYQHNLNSIIDLARSYDLRLVFMTQPFIWKTNPVPGEEDLLWFGWIAGRTEFYTPRVLAQAMARYNQALLNTCQERAVECLDLARILPQDTSIFFDDVHLNEGGSERVAQELFNNFDQFFQRRLPSTKGKSNEALYNAIS